MTEFLAVAVITIFATISPGPDFLMVTRNSLLCSRRAGVFTAFGIGLGIWVHVAYSICGIGMLISKSILLFNVLKFIGAFYLLYLGVSMLRSKAKPETAEIREPEAMPDWKALRVGFMTNAINPKSTIFLVSLFMQVVNPTTPISVQIAYGAFI